MDKRSFLKGLAAITAVAVTPVVFKTNVLATTSMSPIPRKEFHRYDSVAMAYVKGVLNREVKLTYRSHTMVDRNTYYTHGSLVQPDPVRTAFFVEHDRKAREYFDSLPKVDYYNRPMITLS